MLRKAGKILFFWGTWRRPHGGAVHQQAVAAGDGVSSIAHPLATLAGLQILARGGNAIDAAVATAFALPVMEPAMSSITGQGFVLIWVAKTREIYALDYYSIAPAKATPDTYRWIESPTLGGYQFQTEGDKNATGALSVAVPGSLAAFCRILQKYGTVRLKEVRKALEDMGHKMIVKKDWDPWFGAVQAVMIDSGTGAIHGGADPRRDGAAAGYSGGKAITGKAEK